MRQKFCNRILRLECGVRRHVDAKKRRVNKGMSAVSQSPEPPPTVVKHEEPPPAPVNAAPAAIAFHGSAPACPGQSFAALVGAPPNDGSTDCRLVELIFKNPFADALRDKNLAHRLRKKRIGGGDLFVLPFFLRSSFAERNVVVVGLHVPAKEGANADLAVSIRFFSYFQGKDQLSALSLNATDEVLYKAVVYSLVAPSVQADSPPTLATIDPSFFSLLKMIGDEYKVSIVSNFLVPKAVEAVLARKTELPLGRHLTILSGLGEEGERLARDHAETSGLIEEMITAASACASPSASVTKLVQAAGKPVSNSFERMQALHFSLAKHANARATTNTNKPPAAVEDDDEDDRSASEDSEEDEEEEEGEEEDESSEESSDESSDESEEDEEGEEEGEEESPSSSEEGEGNAFHSLKRKIKSVLTDLLDRVDKLEESMKRQRTTTTTLAEAP